MESWLIWGLVLLVQNASFTLVSRARNSRSLAYHGVAAVISNSTWLLSQLIIVRKVISATTFMEILITLLFYVTITTTSSVLMHWALLRWVENGRL